MLEVLQMFLFLFVSKYRRKIQRVPCYVALVLFLAGCCTATFKCNDLLDCGANGICKNDTCECFDGWQGPMCQYCGGKVRIGSPFGVIHEGIGNYTDGLKCSWLIDAPNKTITLHLEEFATECGWDHLYIYDGDSVESQLLAVFSGLMYKNDYKIRKVPEVKATSGYALIHFFTDDAYNMTGFNMTYRWNACPSVVSGIDCSGNGKCIDGYCTCDGKYTGEACHLEKCPNDCNSIRSRGRCEPKEGCVCNEGYQGEDCGQLAANGWWEQVKTYGFKPPGSASHGVAVWRDSLYAVAGESYGRASLLYVYDLNGQVWETIYSEYSPTPRYGHSTVLYGDKLFLYGGVLGNQGPCSELLAFDVSAKTWENVTVKTPDPCGSGNLTAPCGPLKSAGHTATVITDADGQQPDRMVVIFGLSPTYGYLNTVQEYVFGTRQWTVVNNTRGYPVKGGYGHTASWDPLSRKIYVYGGVISESESAQVLSRHLYSYDPMHRVWMLLSDAPSARFLHSASFVTPGLMMVFGGNTHNDTSRSYGAKCYSSELLTYDVLCQTWHILDSPPTLKADMARYGHAAVVFEGSLYIYGGFDGQMLSDILKYTPGLCSHFTTSNTCLNSRPGVKCIWDTRGNRCLPIAEVRQNLELEPAIERCPVQNRSYMTHSYLQNKQKCGKFEDCSSCIQTTSNCVWCGSNCTYYDECREDRMIKKLEQCPYDPSPVCKQLHTCNSCSAQGFCKWKYEISKCVDSPFHPNLTGDVLEQGPCPKVCAEYTSCLNCTQEECIWCQNEGRCVDKNAYITSFPYGQCREWTTSNTKCRTQRSEDTSQCSFYLTCSQCRSDPACGWCDDGSNTGLGKCMKGGSRGPTLHLQSLPSNTCPPDRWYFTTCPHCQCNGHATCRNGTCTACGDLTMGPHCEHCRPGFFGNPINGGQCSPCDCNGQAKHCHPETGKCYCTTKGLTGDHCEKCDAMNNYHGMPLDNGHCYYDLTIDYQFTFNLSKKEDRHYTQINFKNSPVKSDIDAEFTITCSVPAKMNITVKRANSKDEKPVYMGYNCTTFKSRFAKSEYNFGIEDNITLTTFHVYVYDVQPPLWIQISFSQYPKLNLQQFFITFSTCFLLLLLVAAILWKIKQRYDMYRRRQRLFVEMEQMASRPFSQVLVELEVKEAFDPEAPPIADAKRKKRDAPSPIALEPCYGSRAAVLSLLVRLPTGGEPYTVMGQSAGLAIASGLVTLGNPRKMSVEQIKTETKGGKTRKSQSQHPDSCL